MPSFCVNLFIMMFNIFYKFKYEGTYMKIMNLFIVLILIVIASVTFISAQEQDYEVFQLGEAFIYWEEGGMLEVIDFSGGYFTYYEDNGSHYYSVDLPTYADDFDYFAPFFIEISHNAFNMVWAMEDSGTTTNIEIYDALNYELIYSETIFDFSADDDYLTNVEYQVGNSGYRILSKIELMEDIELNDEYVLGEGTYFSFKFDQDQDY